MSDLIMLINNCLSNVVITFQKYVYIKVSRLVGKMLKRNYVDVLICEKLMSLYVNIEI